MATLMVRWFAGLLAGVRNRRARGPRADDCPYCSASPRHGAIACAICRYELE